MIIHGMSDKAYFDAPRGLSSTWARKLLPEFGGTPARYKYERDQYEAKGPPEGNPAFDFGHAVHSKILGVGNPTVTYPGEHLTKSGAISTKAETKAWQEEQRANGLDPITPKEAEALNAMAESVLANTSARAFLEVAHWREVAVFGEVDGQPTQARFDALAPETPQGPIGIDLKTTRGKAAPEDFTREVLNYGYHFQQEWYRDTYRASESAEMAFLFIVVEKEPPYLTAVHQLDVVYQQMGKTLAREARRIYAECKASGVWPGYPDDVQLVAPPVWAAMRHEEKYGD